MKRMWVFFFTILSFSRVMCTDISWSPPVTISNAGASDPQVVMDSNGNATAVWVESGAINAATQPIGGGWSAATTLADPNASTPKLIVDSNGDVTALWVANGVVQSSRLPFNGSWGPTVTLSDLGALAPDGAVDTSSNIVAIWTRGGFIETATQPFSTLRWGVPTQISGENSDSPQIAIGADGTIVAIWHSVVSGQDTILAASSVVLGTWKATATTTQTIFQSTLSNTQPKIAVDSKGNAVAVWYQATVSGLNYVNVGVLASLLPARSNSWSTPVLISGLGKRNPADLGAHVRFDANRNAIAMWVNSYDEETFAIESAILPPGESWSPSAQLTALDLYAYTGDVSVASYGDALAVYMSFDGVSSVLIQATESDIAGVTQNFWSIPQTISQGSDNGYPKCAVVLTGSTINAAAVWISSSGGNNTIQATTGSRPILSPPTSPMVVQGFNDFGVFIEYFNTLSWGASPDLNTVGYIVYRNGLFFTRTDAATFQIIARNEVKNGSVTYGVASVDSNRSQSTTVDVSFP